MLVAMSDTIFRIQGGLPDKKTAQNISENQPIS